MSLAPGELALVGSLGGAIVGAIPGLVALFLNRQSEERKQFKELVFKSALESWKLRVDKTGIIPPLETYVIHAAAMCEFAFAKKKITPEDMAKHLQELSAVMEVMAEHSSQSPGKKVD
jgi:hypothetical protein